MYLTSSESVFLMLTAHLNHPTFTSNTHVSAFSDTVEHTVINKHGYKFVHLSEDCIFNVFLDYANGGRSLFLLVLYVQKPTEFQTLAGLIDEVCGTFCFKLSL